MFVRSPDTSTRPITVMIDGAPVIVHDGDTVAAALLLADIGWTRRSPVSGAPRAPYCMMGVCFECLVTIDGIASEQACLRHVREGMRIERPRQVPGLRA